MAYETYQLRRASDEAVGTMTMNEHIEDREETISVQGSWTFADIMEANRYYLRNRVGRWLMFATAIGVAGWEIMTERNQGISWIFVPLLCLFLAIAAPTIAGLGGWFLNTSKYPFTLTLTPVRVSIEEQGVAVSFEWHVFKGFTESKSLFLVHLGLGELFLIPKRLLEPEDIDCARCWIAQTRP
ncbi:MAG: YcxB family protein [Gemmataceae bacterium]